MSIPVSAFAHPHRYTITLEIPQCFTEIIEYVYKMEYNDVVDAIQLGTIKDEIKFGITGNICVVPVFRYMMPHIIKVEVIDITPTFAFVCEDHTDRHTMLIHAHERKTVFGIIAWILLQSNSEFLECLNLSWDYLSPYNTIEFIAEHKDEDALYALCSYAYTQNEFNVLIDRLARSNAVEETALALRWNRDMTQANISAWSNQQDKFEL